MGNEINGKDRELFENGNLKQKINRKFEIYYNDGKLKLEKEYKNGKLWNMKEYNRNNKIINELNEEKG